MDHRLRCLCTAVVLLSLLPAVSGQAQQERDYVSIVGPRTVYPFVSAVIERFGIRTRFKYPRIEATETAAGISLFCSGEGFETPDMVLATREITDTEDSRCQRNLVTNLLRSRIGYDAVALVSAAASEQYDLEAGHIFLAMAAQVPDPQQDASVDMGDNGLGLAFVANPYRTWSEIDDALPNRRIRFVLPPRTAIETDIFYTVLMRNGCRQVDAIATLEETDPNAFEQLCRNTRDLEQSGIAEEFHSEPEALADRLVENVDDIAIVRLPFLRNWGDQVQSVLIDGNEASIETVNDGTYPAARPLQIYMKRNHVSLVPGLREFVSEFIGRRATGRGGYLVDIGLVPLAEEQRDQVSALVSEIIAVPDPSDVEDEEAVGVSAESRLRDIELDLWETVRDADDPDELDIYLGLFPDGLFREPARIRRAVLRRRDDDGDGVPNVDDTCQDTPDDIAVDDDGCPVDTDGDGVSDDRDQCAETPAGTPVDDEGCPPDADADGVEDLVDQCPETAEGILVDDTGCLRDSDGDGVGDDVDQCGRTPEGTVVDATGCPLDSDADGVVDGDDQCAATPPGTAVDGNGCPIRMDTDLDGVLDEADACPNTPSGAEADARGCWVIQGLVFAPGAITVDPVQFAILDEVVGVLRANPALRVTIEGHTDNSGVRQTNLVLSQRRAQAVADYLIAQTVSADRLTVIGRGPDEPVAPNTTADGRQLNRRVELTPEIAGGAAALDPDVPGTPVPATSADRGDGL